MSANKWQKGIRELASADNPDAVVHASKVVCRGNGSVEIKHTYFYHHGYTAEKWAQDVASKLTAVGCAVRVDARDDWRDWPKDSELVAIVWPA